MKDEHVYGFSFSDANDLLAGRGGGSGREVPLHQRPMGNGGRCIHFKSSGSGIPAFNEGTLTMGSASCTKYVSDSSGVLSSNGTVDIYNAGGSFAPNTWGVAMLNEAGLYVAIVERCTVPA